MENRKRKIICVAFVILVIVFSIPFMMQKNIKTDSCEIGDEYYLQELSKGTTLLQTFVMPGNRLNGIEIILTDFDNGVARIELYKKDGTIIDTASLNLKECTNGQFQEIRFKKKPFLHKGDTYLVRVAIDSNSNKTPKIIMIPSKNGTRFNETVRINSNVIENYAMAINYDYQDGPINLILFLLQIQISIIVLVVASYIWKGCFGKKQSNALLLHLLATSLFIWLISVFLTKGQTLYTIIHQNDNDVFMDFFNSIQYGREPYERGVIYPPLANLLYAALGHIIPANRIVSAVDVRNTQMGGIVYYLYALVITYFLIQLIHVSGYSFSKRIQNVMFDMCILLSTPFIFCYERGNIILLCLVCCMAYYYFNDIGKERRSYIGLALAVGIKIYPAIYGLLEIRNRKKCFCLICMSIVVFLAPFAFFPSGSFEKMIMNIISTSAGFQNNGVGLRHDLENFLHIIQITFDVSFPKAVDFGIRYGCVLVGTIVILFTPNLEKWKQLCICSAIIILFPGFSYTYTLIFMLIPLLAFMKNDSFEKIDYAYLSLFALIFMPYIVPNRTDILGIQDVHYTLTYATLFQTVAMIALYTIIIVESLLSVLKKKYLVRDIYDKQ